ncbi:hypothetical protein [Treponema pectinovorum]|uniref:hypothetical protein n=1 Tax=Treponema pectinovorum TaxID=164 RepID=UPI003D8DAA8C
MDAIPSQKTEIFGRKIFFLGTTFSLNTNIILRLMEQEYEVYKVEDHRQLKSILSANPKSIVYINADNQNNASTWFNFIQYFETATEFSSTSFGVFTGKLKGQDRERFKSALKLEAGFFTLDKTFAEILPGVLSKLDSLHAKGVRQFVRLNCANNKDAEVYFVSGNMMYKMNFIDISSIGVGIVIPVKYAQIARVNTVIQGLTLVLGPKQIKVNAKIHTVKAMQTGILAVLIFTPDTPDNLKSYIRTYIFEELQKSLVEAIMQLPYDKTDYSIVLAPEDSTEEKEQTIAQKEKTAIQDKKNTSTEKQEKTENLSDAASLKTGSVEEKGEKPNSEEKTDSTSK